MRRLLLAMLAGTVSMFSGLAYGQSSAHYKIEAGVISGGGGEGSSKNYNLSSSIGQSSPIGISSSSGYVNYAGFWYAIEGGEFFYLSLGTGWNLISLPLNPSDTSILSVLNDISGHFTIVWSYQNGKWKMYDPAKPGLSDLLTVEAAHGYWIKMTQTDSLEITGAEPSNTLNLSAGWNMVGLNSTQSIRISDALSSIATKVIIVWAYQNGKWKMYDPANPGFSDLTSMDSGYGYWIKVTESCTWTLP